MEKIEIKAKVEFNEYLKLMYYQIYKKKSIILITLFSLAMSIPAILYYLGVLDINYTTPPFLQLSFGFGVVILLPLILFYTIKKGYNNVLQETIKYTFSEEGVGIAGDTFNANLKWEYILKIEELNNWILIYQNKLAVNYLPKSSFSKEELRQFKELINSLPDLKKKLKK